MKAEKKITFENIGSIETQTGLVTVSLTNDNLTYYK